jgi:hypothetical protein
VPWPFLALLGGAGLAGLSVYLQTQKSGLALPAFGLGAVSIFAGLVGLYQFLRGRQAAAEAPAAAAEGATEELRLYRDQPFEVGQPLYDRFTDLQAQLRAATADRSLGYDAAAHDRQGAEAEAAAARNDWPAAFVARFRALMLVAAAYHSHRGKDEGFVPKTNS